MLRFRNLTATPADPVTSWGTEGILAAMERGNLTHWFKILESAKDETVRSQIEEALLLCSAEPVRRWFKLKLKRRSADASEQVAERLGILRALSGLNQREFASRLGTSASRLSAYLSGATTPSAAFMIRAEALAADPGGAR